MVDFLLSIVGLASLGGAIYVFFFRFIGQNGHWMWDGVIARRPGRGLLRLRVTAVPAPCE